MNAPSVARYLEQIQRTPRPAAAQFEAFAHFVANDHSWYKHLPLEGAGEPFFLYLAPHPHEILVDTRAGSKAWRPVVSEPDARGINWFRIELEDGDLDPGPTGPLHYVMSGTDTATYYKRYGRWAYWNHGPPDQPADEAIDAAERNLKVLDATGQPIPVPREALTRGLVCLRATISGSQGGGFRDAEGTTAQDQDRRAQLRAMVTAMERVVDWVYGPEGHN